MRIYLAGKVQKTSEGIDAPDWRADYTRALGNDGHFEFLHPDDPTLDESRPEVVFGHDCWMLQQADVIVVNASEKLGAGTAQEMIIAKHFAKPVLTVLPRGSHHRRRLELHGQVVEDWKHPFVFCTSDEVFDDLDSLRAYLDDRTNMAGGQPKTMRVIDEAIATYLASSHPGAGPLTAA